MQKITKVIIDAKEKVQEKQIKKCPECGRHEKTFIRNFLGTLECMCGVKFHGR